MAPQSSAIKADFKPVFSAKPQRKSAYCDFGKYLHRKRYCCLKLHPYYISPKAPKEAANYFFNDRRL
jgi:hypothetical protein